MKFLNFIKKNEKKLRTNGSKRAKQGEGARAKTPPRSSSESERDSEGEEEDEERATRGVETRKQKLNKKYYQKIKKMDRGQIKIF